jgi:DNA-binding Xre family transcriptional regulator
MLYFITFCSKCYVLCFFFRNFGALLLMGEPIAINMDKDINRIKVVLADKKRTNKWLAEQLGKDPATVSKWCTNSCQPTLETLMKIAKLLDVEMNDLVRFNK